MLPAYVIEEILRREKERKRSDECFAEVAEPDETGDAGTGEESDEEVDRGVTIVDFTI